MRSSVQPGWKTWFERLGSLVLLLAAVWLCWHAGKLSLAQNVLLCAGLLAALVVMSQRGWIRLFGPVLFYDMVRNARRGRFVLLRFAYAAVILFLLYSAHSSFISQLEWAAAPKPMVVSGRVIYVQTAASGEVRAAVMARFAESFFLSFMGVQLLTVALLTPAYTAGAIAEEKERKTLEFLLATDLRDGEIVLGKQISALANLFLLILTGIPIISLTQLWGGVDPELVVAGFAATGLTMISLAGVSTLCSVYAKKTRDALIFSYMAAFIYIGLSYLSLALVQSSAVGALTFGIYPLKVQDVVEWLNAGNPPYAISKLVNDWNKGTPLATVLPGLLRDYAIFHVLAAVLCTSLAVVRLRPASLQAEVAKPKKAKRRFHLWRPSVGARPMLWKELFVEKQMAFNWFQKTIVLVIVLISFVPPVFILADFFMSRGYRQLWPDSIPDTAAWRQLGEKINSWVRMVGTVVSSLTLLSVAVRAAGTVTNERERQTLENLLTTPLEARTILAAKWQGSMWSVRGAWIWLCLIWSIGVAFGGLDPALLPLLFAGWLVYAAFFAALGLRLSITSKTTAQATMGTLFYCAVICLGHWLPWVCCLVPTGGYRSGGPAEIMQLQGFIFTPPVALYWLSHHVDLNKITDNSWIIMYPIIFAFVCWEIGAFVLWTWTKRLFGTLTNRGPARPRPMSLRSKASTRIVPGPDP